VARGAIERTLVTLAWSLFLLYVVVTLGLAWLGHRKTHSLESYAVGDRNMSPWVAGLALAATMTSTATFIVNPGIVYAYGLSAVLGYGMAAGIGLTLGIVTLSKGFRRHGVRQQILTLPHWIGTRYGDRRLTIFYAFVNLLLMAMVVLVCYSMAGLMMVVLGLESLVPGWGFEVALAGTILFVFAYIFFGGTYAHAFTNMAQGSVMIVVAAMLIGSGWHLFDGRLLERLAAIDPLLAAPVNPASLLFRNYLEVFGANFIVGFALAVQPHFIIKSLYVRRERDVNLYLAVAVVCGVLFNLVLLCGLYARVDAGAFIAEYTAANRMGIDGVMPAYILHAFSPSTGVVISIALLAAGMSTLDGMLVAISSIFAHDVYLAWGSRRAAADRMAAAFKVSRYSLIGFGLLAFVLSLVQHAHKQLSVAIFAQEGVYAMFAATFVPVLFGMFPLRIPGRIVLTASVVALAVHFTVRYARLSILTPADFTNPALTASYGLIASLLVVGGWWLATRVRSASMSSPVDERQR
jgi:sodium/pantothenate symporter